MPLLNQISKEEIEKFRKEFWKIQGRHIGELTRNQDYYIEDMLKRVNLRLIDGIIERLENSKKEKPSDKAYVYIGMEIDAYNQGLQEQIVSLHSEKENIKNENNK